MSKKLPPESSSLTAEILDAVSRIDRPADFCTSGQCLTVLPCLKVDGVGDIAFPLSASEAKRLIKVCRQAPYGKGTETLVDTKVRKVWELDPQQFSLENPKWPLMIDLTLREVEVKLGLPEKKLAAHLYKLLVYEKGGFFLPHRDGEKLDRMVATLVINLPSKHSGGDLVVYHEGKQATISMSGAAAGSDIDFAAFYADCQHEVKPLLSGYRLCLTYNLVLAKSHSKDSINAPSFQNVTDSLVATLKKWSEGTNSLDIPAKLAVMLEHRYTQEGLLVENLKGVDLAQANVLFDAAEKADCDAHLALVTLWQSGSAEDDHNDYGDGYGKGRRYSSYDDDEGDNESHQSEYSMGEIYDSSLSADYWSNRQSNKVAFGQIPLEESEIVSNIELTETDPSSEEFEGYTGNAGMTLERWYHRAAVVMWPRRHQLKVFCDAGTDAAVAGLAQMIAKLKKSKKADCENTRQECRQFAFQIIESWRPKRTYNSGATSDRKPEVKRESIFDSLEKLNDSSLANQLIEKVMPKDTALTFSEKFLLWMATQGWTGFTDSLMSMVTQSSASTLPRDIAILRQIALLQNTSRERKNLCNQLAQLLLQAIEMHDPPTAKSWEHPRWQRTEIVVDMVTALSTLGDQVLLARFLNWQVKHPCYELTEVQIPAAMKLRPFLKQAKVKNRATKNWIKGLRTELQLRTASEPKEPADWKRESKLSCTCADCLRLSSFLADPTQQEARFPMAKARRQHLHNIIGKHQCDCTHQTLRVGSPQVLVCKKTNASYVQDCKVYEQNLKHLSFIESVESE